MRLSSTIHNIHKQYCKEIRVSIFIIISLKLTIILNTLQLISAVATTSRKNIHFVLSTTNNYHFVLLSFCFIK